MFSKKSEQHGVESTWERSWLETAVCSGWPSELQFSLNEDALVSSEVVSESPVPTGTNTVRILSVYIDSNSLCGRLTSYKKPKA